MIEYFKFVEELKNIKNDLRDLPARRLKIIDLLIEKYEKLILTFETEIAKAENKYFAKREDDLIKKALEDLEDVNNPDYEKYAGRYGKSVKEWKKESLGDLGKRWQKEDEEMEEALNPLGSYKLVPEKEPVQPELDLEKEDKKAEEEKDLKRTFPEADLGLE